MQTVYAQTSINHFMMKHKYLDVGEPP